MSSPTDASLAHAAPAVSLVGAGPGAVDLLTVRALERVRNAQVLLYDLLVAPEIVALAPADCERICVGKRASRHTMAQADIHALMLDRARRGLRVVRLKGGDPLLFGRGGEEMQALHAAGLRCEVVPGITAATGAAASAGIALTHRDHAQMLALVTGHRRSDAQALHWVRMVGDNATVVVYMGLGEAPRIARELLAQGHPAQLPVAVVAQATLPQQQVLRSTLGELAQALQSAQLPSPALLIIGKVAGLGA